MSRPTPDPQPARELVRAPDDVLDNIVQQVQPQPGLASKVALAAGVAFFYTWVPAFVVFAGATIVSPSTTDDAGTGTAAFWALQFAALIAIVAAVQTAVRRDPAPDADTSIRRVLLRVATQALITIACAWPVLALHGLSTNQIVPLVVALVVMLNVAPVSAARLLQRRRRRGAKQPTRA